MQQQHHVILVGYDLKGERERAFISLAGITAATANEILGRGVPHTPDTSTAATTAIGYNFDFICGIERDYKLLPQPQAPERKAQHIGMKTK